MPSMMKNEPENISPAKAPAADEQSWDALYAQIKTLAIARASALIANSDPDTDQFDRGARVLRTLMGAAEITGRMKTQDAKDQTPNDHKIAEPVITDQRIRDLKRAIQQRIDRVEREDAEREKAGGEPAPAGSAAGGGKQTGGGAGLGGPRS